MLYLHLNWYFTHCDTGEFVDVLMYNSGGSRISRWGRARGKGADLRRWHFLPKICVKTKELGEEGTFGSANAQGHGVIVVFSLE